MSERASPVRDPQAVPDPQEESDGADRGTDADDEPRDDQIATGADAVVAALEAAGVEHLFGVQGGAIMPVYDALYDSDLKHVTMAHEQGAAHAADAYGIVSGRPGVCLATSGPGATNLVTGIADANMDSDPLIALTGQVPTDFVGNDAFQETDTIGITAPITKANIFSVDPDEVGKEVGKAFALAETGRPGPTLVDLPKDVTNGETDRHPGSPSVPERAEPTKRASRSAIESAIDTLRTGTRPVILAGGGVVKGEATEELRRLATTFGIPVITSMPALGAFPEDHDLALEMAGMHGTGYANMAITLCDTLLAIGTRFDDRLTGGVETFAPDARLIHIDIDPAEISKNIEADVPIVGDAATALDQLHTALLETTEPETLSAQYGEWREQCRTWKSEYPMEYTIDEDAPLRPEYVVEVVDAATDDDTIVTTGVGQHQMWAVQYWTYTQPRTWVSSHGLGTMGYGLPAAIGARFAADDDQTVVCFDGDGSFLMTAQGLAVAVHHHLDINVFILNNEAVGMVRQWQDAFFEGRHSASKYPWVPAFDKLAEAFGARGFVAREYDEVEETVTEALAYDGPSVIDVHIDPEANVFPMVPSGGDNSQFALTEEHL